MIWVPDTGETHVIIGNKNTEEEIVLYKIMIEDNKAPYLAFVERQCLRSWNRILRMDVWLFV